MDIPEYVSKEEVQRICDQLGIRDWTELSKPEVEINEAKIIQELAEKVVDDLNEVKISKSDRKEANHGNLS